MKKLITLVAVLVASATVAHAQFGIIAGFNSTDATFDTQDIASNMSKVNQYHVGVAYHIDLPLGFALQPQLTYQVKGANLQDAAQSGGSAFEDLNLKTGFAEFGLGAQWGIDLVAIRPFVLVQPFVGYQVTEEDNVSSINKDMLNKLEYGFSIGAGLELIQHLQLSIKWYKNLGSIAGKDFNTVTTEAQNNWSLDTASYQGWQLSLGLFF